MSQDDKLDVIINGLKEKLYPMIPSLWGVKLIDKKGLEKLLFENKENIKEWLKVNQNLINQL